MVILNIQSRKVTLEKAHPQHRKSKYERIESLVGIEEGDSFRNLQSIESSVKKDDKKWMHNTVRYNEININEASGTKGREGAAAAGGNNVINKPRAKADRIPFVFVVLINFNDKIFVKR